MNSRGGVVWFTGLSGAGKTTLAYSLRDHLVEEGRAVELLDGDALRSFMPTGFSREEREAHVLRVGYFASRLEHHGVIAIASLISPYRASRERVRRLATHFTEVYVSTPLGVCEGRDVKGLYARARAGELKQFTGIDDPYEPPTDPELTIDTSNMTVEEATLSILAKLHAGSA